MGYSPLGHRELVTTEATQHAHIRYKTVWLIQPSFLSLQVSTLTHRENVKSPCASYEVITAHGGTGRFSPFSSLEFPQDSEAT